MSKEQTNKITINVKSYTLGSIMTNHKSILNDINFNSNGISIDVTDNEYLTNVPSSNKEGVKELLSVLKVLINDSKALIKEIKKASKDIISDVEFDWLYVETCKGDLAKEMSQMHKDEPDLHEAVLVDEYIFIRSFKKGIYEENEKVVYL